MGMRDPSQWEPSDSAPPSPAGASPRRAGRPVAAEWLVPVAAALFFVDTFLSWQRACVGFRFIRSPISMCVWANAWRGAGGGFGAAAGIVSIALAVWVVLRLLQAGPGAPTGPRSVERVLAWILVGAGALKWLLVLTRFAAPGAWLGLVLLLVIAGAVSFGPSRT